MWSMLGEELARGRLGSIGPSFIPLRSANSSGGDGVGVETDGRREVFLELTVEGDLELLEITI